MDETLAAVVGEGSLCVEWALNGEKVSGSD